MKENIIQQLCDKANSALPAAEFGSFYSSSVSTKAVIILQWKHAGSSQGAVKRQRNKA